MSVLRGLIVAVLAVAVVGCASDGSATRSASERTGPVPTPDQLANMTYEGISGRPVTLADGRFMGEPFAPGGASRMSVELLDEMIVFGDLDGDGADDAAVLLAESSGGSGSRIWLSAVTARRGGEPASYGTVLVGDRPQIRSMMVTPDDWVRIEVVDRAPGDPACCPSRMWTKEWAVVQGKLLQVSQTMGGELSLENLAGHEWVLTHLDIERPAPREPAITVRFEEGRIAGSAGCNSYFAEVREQSPGSVRLGPVGSTKMACPPDVMRLEQHFLGRLGQVTRYGYWMGELALTWQADDGFGSFLFRPQPAKT